MCQFAQSYQSGLEDVLFEALVGDAAPDTVLAEARCLNAQGAQQRQDGAVHIAVALELDDDQRPHIGLPVSKFWNCTSKSMVSRSVFP